METKGHIATKTTFAYADNVTLISKKTKLFERSCKYFRWTNQRGLKIYDNTIEFIEMTRTIYNR